MSLRWELIPSGVLFLSVIGRKAGGGRWRKTGNLHERWRQVEENRKSTWEVEAGGGKQEIYMRGGERWRETRYLHVRWRQVVKNTIEELVVVRSGGFFDRNRMKILCCSKVVLWWIETTLYGLRKREGALDIVFVEGKSEAKWYKNRAKCTKMWRKN